MIRYRFSIPFKLLVLILPLVSIPIVIVGYLSFESSIKSVTNISKKYHLLQAKEAAREINSLFQSCMDDLETLARTIGDYSEKEHYKDFQEKIRPLVQNYIKNTPYYFQIYLMDQYGYKTLSVNRNEQNETGSSPSDGIFLNLNEKADGEIDIQKSMNSFPPPIFRDSRHSVYLIRLSRTVPVKPGNITAFNGTVTIELNYDKVMELVRNIHIGKKGYAFLVDNMGRTIAHPIFKPYEYDLTRYDDSRLREFVINMLSGDTGWMTFYEDGEKAAAYAPISTMQWSLAVTIPINEFRQDAEPLQRQVFYIVIVMILISTVLVIFISHKIIRPMRKLVEATKQVASGDLSSEIPVRSRDELGLLTSSFNQMIRSLRKIQNELVASEKLISMGRLSAGVAHEIRNPLNAMKGAIVYLQRCRESDDLVMEYTGLIHEEVERLNQFVTEFLLFAKQSPPKKIDTDINELIRNICMLFKNELKAHSVELIQHFDDNLPLIMADPQQLEQVFINIIINALHAIPPLNGRIRIMTQYRPLGSIVSDHSKLQKEKRQIMENPLKTEPPTAVITISDNGTGISNEAKKFIFDPFYSTKEMGTGLGLPISLGIVENHGGKLKLFSRGKEKGVTALIELPVLYPESDS